MYNRSHSEISTKTTVALSSKMSNIISGNHQHLYSISGSLADFRPQADRAWHKGVTSALAFSRHLVKLRHFRLPTLWKRADLNCACRK